MNKDIELHLNNYDGPLDLLLELVKEKKMDVFNIDVSELATEYVRIIEKIKNTNIDLASEYLVMAATLIQLKSRILLESPDEKEEVEEERQGLLKQIVEYQQFKKVAESLREKEKSRDNFYIKDVESYEGYEIEQDESHLDGHLDAVKLIMQMRKMFERVHANHLRETTIEKFNLSPADRRLEIVEMLKHDDHPTFEKLFSVPSINHFVVTMLTILDMARKQELILKQNEQFSTIEILKGEIND